MSEASSLIVSAKPARREHVPLGILYMVSATIVFAVSSAVSKWMVASYPVGEVLFTRTSVALLTCALFILPHTGLACSARSAFAITCCARFRRAARRRSC